MLLVCISVLVHCSCNSSSDFKKISMPENAEEKIIINEEGRIIAKININGKVLNGTCEWYDANGNLIVYGFFKNGIPFSGTFLNWSDFSAQISKNNPYDPITYCRDWITLFEASYDSDVPDYKSLIEVYSRGEKFK